MSSLLVGIVIGLLALLVFMAFLIYGKLIALQEFELEVLTRSPCIGCGTRWESVTLAGGVKGLSRNHKPNCPMKEVEEEVSP